MFASLLENADRKYLLKFQQVLIQLLPDEVEVELWRMPMDQHAVKVTRADQPDKIVSISVYDDGSSFHLMGGLKFYKHPADLIIPIYNQLGWVTAVERGKSLKAKARELWDAA
jgi:hypothetical protein